MKKCYRLIMCLLFFSFNFFRGVMFKTNMKPAFPSKRNKNKKQLIQTQKLIVMRQRKLQIWTK